VEDVVSIVGPAECDSMELEEENMDMLGKYFGDHLPETKRIFHSKSREQGECCSTEKLQCKY
jgi:Mg2+ and Co2+ transporter CorA